MYQAKNFLHKEFLTFHLSYTEPGQRERLLLQYVQPLQAFDAKLLWYFCDIDLSPQGYLIEVFIQYKTIGVASEMFIEQWLEKIDDDDHVEVYFSEEPYLLQPDLFSTAEVPAYYLPALRIGSSRAVNFISSGEFMKIESRLGHITNEICFTYCSVFHLRIHRIKALTFYYNWLDAVMKHRGEKMIEEISIAETCTTVLLPDYTSILSLIPSSEAEQPMLDTFQNIARLCHIQVLRLWGHSFQGQLQTEMSCIKRILLMEGDNRPFF